MEIDEADWNLFLAKDTSIMRALYEMYEFRYIAIHGVFLVFKVFMLLPVVFMERNSVGQLALAGGVEVGLLVLLSATDAFINPWMDALARVGSFHQILQIGLVALSRVLDEHAQMIGYAMIAVSLVYIAVLLVVIVHDIVLPYLASRRMRAAELEVFRLRSVAAKWVGLALLAIRPTSKMLFVPITDYFSPKVLSGAVDPLHDVPLRANPTEDDDAFRATEYELLKSAKEAPKGTLTIPVHFTHLINKAIRTAPTDPKVYSDIAKRLTLMPMKAIEMCHVKIQPPPQDDEVKTTPKEQQSLIINRPFRVSHHTAPFKIISTDIYAPYRYKESYIDTENLIWAQTDTQSTIYIASPSNYVPNRCVPNANSTTSSTVADDDDDEKTNDDDKKDSDDDSSTNVVGVVAPPLHTRGGTVSSTMSLHLRRSPPNYRCCC